MFTEGYFTEAALDVLFGNTQDMQVVGNDIEYHRNISAKMVQRVVEALGLPDDRLWLDIGFGNGSLLMTAKEFGFEVFGIDLRKKNVEDLQELGIPAHHGTLASAIAEVAFKAKPTVISMADVVEHEPYPLDTLRAARELINSPGMAAHFHAQRKFAAVAPLERNRSRIRTGMRSSTTTTSRENGSMPRCGIVAKRLYAALRDSGFRPRHYAISERYRGCMEILAETA